MASGSPLTASAIHLPQPSCSYTAAARRVSSCIMAPKLGEPTMIYYLPEAQSFGPGTGLFVRTRGPARESSEAVRRELQRLAPGTVYVSARPLQHLVDPEVRPWRLGATMFTGDQEYLSGVCSAGV